MWDHELFARPGGQFMIFETKAVVAAAADQPWRSPVDRRQLHQYLEAGGDDIINLFPARPAIPGEPWKFQCSCARWAWRRRRSVAIPQIRSVSADLRLQPWFSHWAWCMTAADLQPELKRARNGSTSTGTTRIPADDVDFQKRPATRLCRLLTALAHAAGAGRRMRTLICLRDFAR